MVEAVVVMAAVVVVGLELELELSWRPGVSRALWARRGQRRWWRGHVSAPFPSAAQARMLGPRQRRDRRSTTPMPKPAAMAAVAAMAGRTARAA